MWHHVNLTLIDISNFFLFFGLRNHLLSLASFADRIC
jgi:hypothetical protein